MACPNRPEIQKLFVADAEIVIDAEGANPVHVSPAEFARSIGRMAFISGARHVAVGDTQYALDQERATVRMKKFLIDPQGSVVVNYEMVLAPGQPLQIKQLRQAIRHLNDAEQKQIDQAIKEASPTTVPSAPR